MCLVAIARQRRRNIECGRRERQRCPRLIQQRYRENDTIVRAGRDQPSNEQSSKHRELSLFVRQYHCSEWVNQCTCGCPKWGMKNNVNLRVSFTAELLYPVGGRIVFVGERNLQVPHLIRIASVVKTFRLPVSGGARFVVELERNAKLFPAQPGPARRRASTECPGTARQRRLGESNIW